MFETLLIVLYPVYCCIDATAVFLASYVLSKST